MTKAAWYFDFISPFSYLQLGRFPDLPQDLEIALKPVSMGVGTVPGTVKSVKLDVSNNQTAQADRLVVMVVDDLHIYRERTDRARDIARSACAV